MNRTFHIHLCLPTPNLLVFPLLKKRYVSFSPVWIIFIRGTRRKPEKLQVQCLSGRAVVDRAALADAPPGQTINPEVTTSDKRRADTRLTEFTAEAPPGPCHRRLGTCAQFKHADTSRPALFRLFLCQRLLCVYHTLHLPAVSAMRTHTHTHRGCVYYCTVLCIINHVQYWGLFGVSARVGCAVVIGPGGQACHGINQAWPSNGFPAANATLACRRNGKALNTINWKTDAFLLLLGCSVFSYDKQLGLTRNFLHFLTFPF